MHAPPVLRRSPAPGVWHLPAKRPQLARGRAYSIIRCDHKNLCSYFRRRRTVFERGAALRFLAGRRTLARQCRELGFDHVGCGVWYDPNADVRYCSVLSDEWGL